MKVCWRIVCFSVAFSSAAFAQDTGGGSGIELGPVFLRPTVDLEAAYDDRVVISESGNSASGDLYSQWTAGAQLDNGDALYGLSLQGQYGWRYFSDYSALNDDFYSVGAGLASGQESLRWGISALLNKALDYDTVIDSSTGEGPSGILSEGGSRRFTANANVSYQKNISERTAVSPYVGASHYFEDFETGGNDAEWQTYSAGCEGALAYSENTLITLTGDVSAQVNDDEDGTVSTVTIGTRSRLTEKISWDAAVGYSFADYEDSGTSSGLAGQIRLAWQVTEKVTTFGFAGQQYQPGYSGGGARDVYRAGYGANWQISPRWSFGAQGLHNYEDAVDGDTSGAGFSGVEHFYSISTTHALTRLARISSGINFVNDEEDVDQLVYFVRLSASL